MKKMMVLAAMLLLAGTAAAQDYKWGVGVRFGGETAGLSVKHNFSSARGLEAILAYPWDDGFTATVLYEWQMPVITDGFSFYYGAGGHIGAWDDEFAIGVDGIVGLEYKLRKVPLAFSVDYKPIFNIGADTKFYMLDFALSMKVTF